jgi:hypothetical protein
MQVQSNSIITSLKGLKRFVSLQTHVVITEEYNVTIHSEELIGTTEYLTL